MTTLKKVPVIVYNFFRMYLGKISSHVLGWITIVFLHFAPVPTLVSVLLNKSDRLPTIDVMIFIWSALLALFFKALIERNLLYIATICLGFCAQTVLMSLILFR